MPEDGVLNHSRFPCPVRWSYRSFSHFPSRPTLDCLATAMIFRETWAHLECFYNDNKNILHSLELLFMSMFSFSISSNRVVTVNGPCAITQSMSSIGNKFVTTPLFVQCPSYKHHTLRLRALGLDQCLLIQYSLAELY